MSEGNLEKFRDLLDKEISYLRDCFSLAKDLKLALKDRDYENLFKSIEEIDSFSENIRVVEADRDREFSLLKKQYGLMADCEFRDFLDSLEFDDKFVLSQLHQTLRLEVMRVQGVFWSINAFMETASETISVALSSLRKGMFSNVYNRYGSMNDYSSVPVLLSKEL